MEHEGDQAGRIGIQADDLEVSVVALPNLFRKKTPEDIGLDTVDTGILVFSTTSEVIGAEKVLKKSGWPVRVMGPPPEIRSGCDLVIEFPLMDEFNVMRTLQGEGLAPLEVVPVSSPLLKPVDLFTVDDARHSRDRTCAGLSHHPRIHLSEMTSSSTRPGPYWT